MESELKTIDERLLKLVRDVEFIKCLLMSKVDDEGKLSDWAKEELAKARDEPKENYISLEDLRKEIENDL